MKEIELPDGSIVEFPDDMDDAAIQNVLSQQFKPTPQREINPSYGSNTDWLDPTYVGQRIRGAFTGEKPIPRTPEDETIVRGASQAPVFNFADELDARAKQFLDSRSYSSAISKNKELDTSLQERFPSRYRGSEIVSSLISPSPAGKIKGAGKLLTIGAEGGLNALGSSEGKSLADFASGAVSSIAVSKGLEGISKVLGPARGAVRNWLQKQADMLKTRQIMGGGDVSSMRKIGAFDPDFQQRINEVVPDRMMWRSPDYRQKYLTEMMDELSLKKAGDISKIRPGVGVTPRSMLGAGEQAREGLKMNISRDVQLPGSSFKDTVRTSSLDPAANRPFTRYEKFITEATPLEQRMIQTESGATVPKMFAKQDEPIPVSEVDKILSNVQRQSRWSKAGQDSAGERSWKGISNKLRQTVEEDLKKTGDPSVQDYLATRNKMFSTATAMDANKYALEKEGNKSIFGLLTPMEGITTAVSAGTAIPLIAARRYGNAFGSTLARGGQKALDVNPKILDAISLGIDKGAKRPASYFSSKRD